MKISELIAYLQTLDQNLECWINNEGGYEDEAEPHDMPPPQIATLVKYSNNDDWQYERYHRNKPKATTTVLLFSLNGRNC